MIKRKILKTFSSLIILFLLAGIIFTFNTSFLEADLSNDSDIVLKKLYTDEFPEIVFYIDFKEGSKIGSMEIEEDDLRITENGKEIRNVRIEKVDTIKEPIGVVLLLDTSGSMKGEPIAAAKAATNLFIEKMRRIDKFAVVGFSDDVKVHSSFTKDRQQLFNSIAAIEAEGETSLFDGIDISINQFKNIDLKYKYIVLLSDGMDTVSKLKNTDNITRAQQENITIYSIALKSKDYNPSDLQKISESTGGEMLIAASAGELQDLYSSISRKIRNQYKITYKSLWPNIKTIESSIFIEKSGISESTTLSYNNPFFTPKPSNIIKIETASYLQYLNIWWVRIIVYAAIFICILFFLIALILIIFRNKPVLKKKTEIYGSQTAAISYISQDTAEEKSSGDALRRRAGTRKKTAGSKGFVEFFNIKLERAGLKIRGSEFMTLQISAVVLFSFLIHFFFRNVLFTSAIAIVLIIMPILLINVLISRRIQRFDEQLPDTLQLISGALKAGYSFNQAMSMVVSETKPPISDEFSRILNEVRMGMPEKEALENSAERIGSSHFSWVVMAINVQREVGGNLAEIMEIIAETIRERARVLNQIRALTSEGRLSAIILIALPVILGILLFTLNRAYLSLLFTNRLGLIMVVLSAVLMVTGIIWILKIVNVKY